jgi:hypothetical protein
MAVTSPLEGVELVSCASARFLFSQQAVDVRCRHPVLAFRVSHDGSGIQIHAEFYGLRETIVEHGVCRILCPTDDAARSPEGKLDATREPC